MLKPLKKLRHETIAATAVEYGLILAMIFLAMIAALQGVGNSSTEVWSDVQTASSEAIGD